MDMPKGYNETQGFSDYTPLAPGGYVCKIIKLEEMQSSTGKPMIKVALDIAEGPEAGRFREQFDADTRDEKKWPCVAYQLVTDGMGVTTRGFKGFNMSLEESNDGWKPVWGDAYAANCKNKLIGVIFGREEYENRDGELRWITKPQFFRSADTIRKGDFRVPEDKHLPTFKEKDQKPDAAVPEGFAQLDDDIPF